jgi:hypothetical protein
MIILSDALTLTISLSGIPTTQCMSPDTTLFKIMKLLKVIYFGVIAGSITESKIEASISIISVTLFFPNVCVNWLSERYPNQKI